jgi:hypothetical protein
MSFYEKEESKHTLQDILTIAIRATIEEDRYTAATEIEDIRIENDTFFTRVICNFFIIAANYFDPVVSKRWIIENVINDGVDTPDRNLIVEFQSRFETFIIRQRPDVALSLPFIYKGDEIFFTYRVGCYKDQFAVEIDKVVCRPLSTNTIVTKDPKDVFPETLLNSLTGTTIAINEKYSNDPKAFMEYYSLHDKLLLQEEKVTVYQMSLQAAYYSSLRNLSSSTILFKLYDFLIENNSI